MFCVKLSTYLYTLAETNTTLVSESSKGLLVKTAENAFLTRGDINDDGYVDNIDAAFILMYDAGLADLPFENSSLGDINNDGCIDNIDASLILKYDAGLLDEFRI